MGISYTSFPRKRESSAYASVFVLYAIGPLDSRFRGNDFVSASGLVETRLP